MSTMLPYSLFMGIFALSMFGWGRLVRRDQSLSGNIALTVVLGMSITLVVGGILNVLQIATGSTLNVFLSAGVLLAFYSLRHLPGHLLSQTSGSWAPGLNCVVAGLILLTLLIVLGMTVMTPDAYNFHDDYQKYFVHPIKMMVTGSAYGSPLSSVGKAVFGGQALFQAFFVYNLGLGAINVFDSTFCLLLCVALQLEQGIRKRTLWAGVISALLLFLIHPQYVNISSLYSAALFMQAAILLSGQFFDNAKFGKNDTAKFSILLGLLYASLVSLKTTNSFFPLAHFSILLVLLFAVTRDAKSCTRLGVLATVVGTACALPWMYTLLTNVHLLFGSLSAPASAPGAKSLVPLSYLFSRENSFYGASPFQYSVVILLSLLASLTVMRLPRQTGTGSLNIAAAIPVAAGTIALVLIYVGILSTLPPQIHSFEMSLRYAVPFIIGIAPASLLLSYQLLQNQGRTTLGAILTVLVAVAALQYAPQMNARINQSLKCGSTLAFSAASCTEHYRRYNSAVLQKEDGQTPMQTRIAQWQSHIPAGEPVIAWVNAPFYLDYSRNEVFEVDISGLANPWARIPEANYVIWEHQGYATRTVPQLRHKAKFDPLYDRNIASKTLLFIELLSTSEKELIYMDDDVRIFKFLNVTDLQWPVESTNKSP